MKRSEILILGNGYIAQRIQKEWGCRIYDKKILCYQDLVDVMKTHKPHILINCVGYVGENNVDDCEKDIEKCLQANTFLPIWLGEIAFRNPVKVVHISSGCMFHYDYERQHPITEELPPDYYKLFYSRTKIYSESVLNPLSLRCNILIVRIRIPLDIYPHPRNILTKLIKYQKVIDIPNSITYIPDFIKALKHLLEIDARGVFNAVSKGGLRYPKLLDIYCKHVPDFKYAVMPLTDLKLDRTNLLLSVRKLEKTAFKVRKIDQILEECVGKYTRK